MPQIGELITESVFSKHSKLSVGTVRTYGAQGKIKRKKVAGKYQYVWGSDKQKSKYVCQCCGEDENKCGRMMIQKFIDDCLVTLDDLVTCKC